ncbi:hypothetical protein Leryth_014258 [Lithospermum erythrorhizon]|nr:hypothetical protein Leryth_014258 [Lithospermum erythrorhizon]
MQNNQPDDNVLVVLTDKLNGLSPSLSERCIFKVHNHLREANEKAYEPELVSIGPYHRGKVKLQMMEEHKLCYLRLMLQRKNENLAKYVSAMRSLEEEARKCYAEPVELGSDEFVEMLILDSCFVVELMRKYEMGNLIEENDNVFNMDWMISNLRHDLMLFENQLPFVVIRKMFGLIEEKMNNRHFLIYLALRFFRGLLVKSVAPQALGESDSSIKHLLELVHEGVLPLHLRQRSNVEAAEMKEFLYMPCASKLAEAGVKFEKLAEGNLFDITFKNGVMSIPPLRIENRTESVFRNLIAFEQYSDDNYIKLCHVSRYYSWTGSLTSRKGCQH